MEEAKVVPGVTPEPKVEPKEESIPKARLDAEVARRHDAEKKLEALTKAQTEAAKAALVEQNKFKELYDASAPKAALADEMELSVKAYFDEETSDLSDEHKALIPEGAIHKKLAWVFGTQNTVDKTFNQKPKSGLQPDKWYLELKSDDPRFPTLTPKQYVEWKAHNASEKVAVRGGF
jgi:hypothetical protein